MLQSLSFALYPVVDAHGKNTTIKKSLPLLVLTIAIPFIIYFQFKTESTLVLFDGKIADFLR